MTGEVDPRVLPIDGDGGRVLALLLLTIGLAGRSDKYLFCLLGVDKRCMVALCRRGGLSF